LPVIRRRTKPHEVKLLGRRSDQPRRHAVHEPLLEPAREDDRAEDLVVAEIAERDRDLFGWVRHREPRIIDAVQDPELLLERLSVLRERNRSERRG
jgi:hypothetical protein